MGGTADQRYADRLRLIAEDLGSYTAELQSIRNDLADRHIPHPEKGQAVSSRVSAALASSPSAGQRTVPAGVPTEPSTRAVPPPARPRPLPAADRLPVPERPCAPHQQNRSDPRPPLPSEPVPNGSAMPTPDQESLPDVVVGHHPDYGIVAANPKDLPASTWMLERLDFRPVPGELTLYALTDPQRDGADRAARAVTLLRNADLRVDVDAAFDPCSRLGRRPVGAGPCSVSLRSPSPSIRGSALSRPSTAAHPGSPGSFWWNTAGGTTRGSTSTRCPTPSAGTRRWGRSPAPRWRCTAPASRSRCSPASPRTSPRAAALLPYRTRPVSAARSTLVHLRSAPPRSPRARPAPAFRARRRPPPPSPLRRSGRSTPHRVLPRPLIQHP